MRFKIPIDKRTKEAAVTRDKIIFLLDVIMYYPEKNPGTQISSVPGNANTSPTGVHAAPIIS